VRAGASARRQGPCRSADVTCARDGRTRPAAGSAARRTPVTGRDGLAGCPLGSDSSGISPQCLRLVSKDLRKGFRSWFRLFGLSDFFADQRIQLGGESRRVRDLRGFFEAMHFFKCDLRPICPHKRSRCWHGVLQTNVYVPQSKTWRRSTRAGRLFGITGTEGETAPAKCSSHKLTTLFISPLIVRK
jgi:hypothetical protein